ncbi:acyltransferase family protein [Microbacterium sp.]|uniref:acyltransferase family protein n=1 Tax=Microbacterium sp. TaxID=51671 RepID=UPI0039E3CDD9
MQRSTSAGPTVPAAPPARARTPFWDNARFACIVLVVIGHAVQRMTADSDAAYGVYLLVYAFHMPAFAIISGYFSKSGAPNAKQMARVITDIVVPYIIFDTLWWLIEWALTGRGDPNLTTPSWTLWFLLALAIFRLVLPYLALLRWPLLWTVAISIAVGYLPNLDSTFSLARALGLLPFFTLGWWLREHDIVDRFQLLRPRSWPVIAGAVAVFVVAGVLAWTMTDTWRSLHVGSWMFYRDPYTALGGTEWWAGGVRLLLMAIALVLTAAFLALIPLGTYWWTRFGTYTMYIYLLHTFVLYPLREYGVIAGLTPDWLWLPIIVVGSLPVALALGSDPVRKVFRPLVEPRPGWLFADPTLAGKEGRRQDPTGSQRPAGAGA